MADPCGKTYNNLTIKLRRHLAESGIGASRSMPGAAVPGAGATRIALSVMCRRPGEEAVRLDGLDQEVERRPRLLVGNIEDHGPDAPVTIPSPNPEQVQPPPDGGGVRRRQLPESVWQVAPMTGVGGS